MTTLSEVAMVRAKLVKIGNSRGIRLAKPLLEVAGLADEVEIEVAPGVLTIGHLEKSGIALIGHQ